MVKDKDILQSYSLFLIIGDFEFFFPVLCLKHSQMYFLLRCFADYSRKKHILAPQNIQILD